MKRRPPQRRRGKLAQDSNSPNGKKTKILTSERQGRRNSLAKARKAHRLTRFAAPEGNAWYAKAARGIRHWRECQGMTIPEAVERYDIEQSVWYHIEQATKPQKTALHIDKICELTGLSLPQLLLNY